MSDNVLIAKATGASNSGPFTVTDEQPVTIYLYPVGDLTASEYCDLQRKDPDGNWQDVYDNGFGGQVRLDSTVTDIVVSAAGTYRISKDVSTNAIGVAVADVSP